MANNLIVNTPTTLQMEAVECGAAALSMVLRFHGKYRPLEELRVKCGVSTDGSKASNILKAARNLGMEAKGFRKEPQDIKELTFPVILFWNFNHFVVLEGFNDKNEAYINDPALGKKVVSWDEFDSSFTGVVLTFDKGDDFVADGKKPSMLLSLSRRLKGSLSPLSISIIAGIFLTIPGLLIPIFSKIFVDDYLIGGMQEWILPLIMFMMGTILVTAGLNYLQQYYLLKMENKISISESSKLFWHIIRLPMEFFNQRMAGDIGNRISLNDEVAAVLSGQLSINTIGLVSIFFYAGLMFYYDWVLTVISISFIMINILVFKYSTKMIAHYSQKANIDNGKLVGTSMNGIQSIETLKATGGENDFFVKWAGYQAKTINTANAMVGINQSVSIIPSLFTTINVTLIYFVGSLRVMDGEMTIGMLVAFQALMQSFSGPVNNLMGLSATIKNLEGTMNYIDDVLKYPVKDGSMDINTEKITDSKVKFDGKIELKNVSFGYSKIDPPLIKDFNLSIKPTQRVAIVGASGCGKSTMAKVISGLYDIWDGELLIDDIPIDKIDKRIFLNSVSLADQTISMFNATVKENISLWDDSISEAEIIKACKDACIHEDIAKLPDAYETMISEGGRNFSGGQKQRLEIARALLKNPSILIMDEATSALDTITEMRIDENIRKRGCSCIIIAHRLSTIRDADKIIVLDNGKIVQVGVHDELKQIDGIYANLIKG
ncbi:MAG: NHLP family bacteriocin export ABC transporter peptidase/permease/ATPase subunit [Campylobacterota bacterium]|nr:NHLP family bacteriocin export ABC transporter peptidase/permease/ATPase subunit [Campylobacterota bacterium]